MTDVYQIQPSATFGLSESEIAIFNELLTVWQMKLPGNIENEEYYEQRNPLKDLGIAIPPSCKDVQTNVGWATKAVDMLAERSVFDGFTFAGKENEELQRVLQENDFKQTYSEAVISELVHSCSFITVSAGSEDEPKVILNSYSATEAAGVWDNRKKRLKYGFAVVDATDPNATGTLEPTEVNLYLDYATIVCTRDIKTNRWYAKRMNHSQGRPLMEVLRYHPTNNRKMGKSRISKTVKAIVDSAKRALLRAEISSEFFTSPQKYLLGVDPDLFGQEITDAEEADDLAEAKAIYNAEQAKMKAYLGAIMAVTPNENGDIPQFGQLTQMSMQPHSDYIRALANLLAGETNIPISSLGVVADSNPQSYEAIKATTEPLIVTAQSLNRENRNALVNIGRLALAIINGKTISELTDEERAIDVHWGDPALPSIGSMSNAMVQQLAMFPWMVDSELPLERLGYTEEEIARLNEDKRKFNAKQLVNQVKLNATDNEPTEPVRENAGGVETAGSGERAELSPVEPE